MAYLERIKNGYSQFRALHKEQPGAFWNQILYYCFWIYIAFFPIGYGWREVLPPLCLIFLLFYYKHDWRKSVLRFLKVSWLFIFAGLMLFIGIAFSNHPWASLMHAGTGFNKAFILPFIAMECTTSQKRLVNLVWAFMFACFWEGCDGIYQTLTGVDFIMGYTPNVGRLTGSLGDYTVGNYMALTLIPAFGIWFILRQKFSKLQAFFICFTLFWPGLFIFVGAAARSGVLAVAGAMLLWGLIAYGWKKLLPSLLGCGVIFALFMLLRPGRISVATTVNDNRWDLWHLAWEVIKENPWFGAGAGQYNSAFRELGLAPVLEPITISHPHNLYLDLLYAHGITGFLCGAIFFGGFVYWGYKKIKPRLRQEIQEKSGVYWRLTSWFYIGYCAWFINGIFGHDLYRTWWLAQAMIAMGIMIGSVVAGKRLS